NTKVDVSPTERIASDFTGAFKGQPGLRRWRQVRRAADQPGMPFADRVQHFARGFPGSEPLCVRRKGWDVPIPALRRFTALDSKSLGRKLRELLFVGAEQVHPVGPQFCASLAQLPLKVVQHFRRNQELGVFRPAVASFGTPDLLFPEGFAMGSAGILL